MEKASDQSARGRRQALGVLGALAVLWHGERFAAGIERGHRMLIGRVHVDGQPAKGVRVLLILDDMTAVVAGTTTDTEGRFVFFGETVAGRHRAVLLVKVQGPLLAVASREIATDGGESQDFSFETRGIEIHKVHARIAAADGAPSLRIAITPVHLNGVPAALERFVLRRDERVVEDAFHTFRPQDDRFDLSLQEGTYRIAGTSLDKGGPLAGGMAQAHAVVGVTIDGEEVTVAGNPQQGFLIDIDRELSLTLRLEERPPGPTP